MRLERLELGRQELASACARENGGSLLTPGLLQRRQQAGH